MLGQLIRKVQLFYEISVRKLNLVSIGNWDLLFNSHGQLEWVTKPFLHKPILWVRFPGHPGALLGLTLSLSVVWEEGWQWNGVLKVLGSQGRTADTGRSVGAWGLGLLGPVILGMNIDLLMHGPVMWWGWDSIRMKELVWMFTLERKCITALKYRANWLSTSTGLFWK